MRLTALDRSISRRLGANASVGNDAPYRRTCLYSRIVSALSIKAAQMALPCAS